MGQLGRVTFHRRGPAAGASSAAVTCDESDASALSANVQSKMPPDAKPTIVLVHGAFADASSWGKVIGLLQREGYTVVAVENAMTSFEGDVVTTERALDAQASPVVLVAHSYGGMVIGAAAHDRAKVKALVFVAAFGLDEGESVNGAGARFAAPPLSTAVKQDASGFLSVDPAKFDIFANDVPAAERDVLAATQRPILGSIFDLHVPAPAWKTIPSFFLVAANDEAINPDFERFMAKRMGATTVEVKSSHLTARPSRPRRGGRRRERIWPASTMSCQGAGVRARVSTHRAWAAYPRWRVCA